jgi:hypothetical protein
MNEHPTTARDLKARDLEERLRERRTLNQTRHSQALTKLMTEREDLHGVHALADFVADSLRWTA